MLLDAGDMQKKEQRKDGAQKTARGCLPFASGSQWMGLVLVLDQRAPRIQRRSRRPEEAEKVQVRRRGDQGLLEMELEKEKEKEKKPWCQWSTQARESPLKWKLKLEKKRPEDQTNACAHTCLGCTFL